MMESILKPPDSKRRFRCPSCRNIIYADSLSCRFCGTATEAAVAVRLAGDLAAEQAREREQIEEETERDSQMQQGWISRLISLFFGS